MAGGGRWAKVKFHPQNLAGNLNNWLINSLEVPFPLDDFLVRQCVHRRETRIPPRMTASKIRYLTKKVNMRTQPVLVILFIFFMAVSCVAQLPVGSAPAPAQDRQSPAV